jgi:hypothetical protein
MEEIPCFYYDSIPLEQKYQWMRSGPGGAASIGFGDGLAQLAADFNASDANIGRNLLQRRLGTEWQGQAATAATEALNRASAAIAANAVPSTTGRDSSHQYGDSFNATKNAIQPVPDAGQNSWWGRQADAAGTSLNDTFGSTFGVQSDYSKRLAAYRAADQAANDALVRHETTTRTVLTAYQNAITGQAAADVGPKAVPGATPRGGAGGHGAGGLSAARAGSKAGGAGTGGSAVGAAAGGAQHGVDPVAGAAASAPPTLPSTTAPSTTAPSSSAPTTSAPLTPAPTTAPAGFAPLNPPGGGSLMPGPSGGFVPTGPGSGAGSPPRSSIPPPLPPLGGYSGYSGDSGHGGAGADRHDGSGGARQGSAGYGGAGYSGAGGEHGGGRPLSPRGGGMPSTEPAARFAGSGPAEGAGRAGGPAGMAGGGMGGGMGGHGQEREHRNSVFIPDDEPFRVEFDDVTPSVIGLPDEH